MNINWNKIVIYAGFAILLASTMTGCCYTSGSADRGWVNTGATQKIKPNAYGLGVHMDQFGRPVRTVPAW